MNPNWLGITSAILAFVAFHWVHRWAKKVPVRKRVVFALVPLVAAIPGASFAIHYAHVLPEAAWYYQFRSIEGTELLMVFLGVAGGWIAALLPRKLLAAQIFFCKMPQGFGLKQVAVLVVFC